MSPKGNDSSTHRLLEIIRGGRKDAEDDGAAKPAAGKASGRKSRSAGNGRRGKARQRVGVDIGPFGLSMVKTLANGDGQTLQGYWQVPYDDPDIAFDSPEFAQFLHRKLAEFMGPPRKAEIWTLVSSAKAELWHMLVPRVPRNKLADTVYWAARKEKRFDENEFVLDFENQGEVMDKGVPKLRIMAYLVPRGAVEKRRRLFEAAGYKLAGITISPIALQTIFRSGWIPDAAKVSANVFVGRNWSRMDVYSQGNLILSRTMKAGVFSMIEALQIGYNEHVEQEHRERLDALRGQAGPAPDKAGGRGDNDGRDENGDLEVEIDLGDLIAEPEPDSEAEAEPVAQPMEVALDDMEPMEVEIGDIESMEIEADEDAPPAPGEDQPAGEGESEDEAETVEEPPPPPVMDFDQAKRLLYHKLLGRPLGKDDTGSELSAEDAFAMIRPAVERLVRQLERTFEHTANELGSESVEMTFFSGDICTNEMLIDFIQSQIGLRSSLLDPMDPSLPGVANIQVPESAADRLTYNLTIGLALCGDDNAPNLLNTFRQRDQALRAAALNRNLAAAFLAAVLALSGLLLWQQGVLSGRQDELKALQTQVQALQPKLDTATLMLEAGKAKARLQLLDALSRRYESLAVAREIAQLTPPEVRLLSLNLNLGVGPVNGGDKDAKGAKKTRGPVLAAPAKVLILDGVVTGQRRGFDATLATYLVRLQDSPLFATPVVHTRDVETMGDLGETLHFVLHINLPS